MVDDPIFNFSYTMTLNSDPNVSVNKSYAIYSKLCKMNIESSVAALQDYDLDLELGSPPLSH